MAPLRTYGNKLNNRNTGVPDPSSSVQAPVGSTSNRRPLRIARTPEVPNHNFLLAPPPPTSEPPRTARKRSFKVCVDPEEAVQQTPGRRAAACHSSGPPVAFSPRSTQSRPRSRKENRNQDSLHGIPSGTSLLRSAYTQVGNTPRSTRHTATLPLTPKTPSTNKASDALPRSKPPPRATKAVPTVGLASRADVPVLSQLSFPHSAFLPLGCSTPLIHQPGFATNWSSRTVHHPSATRPLFDGPDLDPAILETPTPTPATIMRKATSTIMDSIFSSIAPNSISTASGSRTRLVTRPRSTTSSRCSSDMSLSTVAEPTANRGFGQDQTPLEEDMETTPGISSLQRGPSRTTIGTTSSRDSIIGAHSLALMHVNALILTWDVGSKVPRQTEADSIFGLSTISSREWLSSCPKTID
jgi:hypothetical protein